MILKSMNIIHHIKVIMEKKHCIVSNLVSIVLIIVKKVFEIADTQDSKMVSSVPLKEKKLIMSN